MTSILRPEDKTAVPFSSYKLDLLPMGLRV
jgi:hypothetical protein